MTISYKLLWRSRISAIVLAVGILGLLPGTVMAQAGGEQIEIFLLGRDHMVNHPAGAHYVLWNGPRFLDVGLTMSASEFSRFEVARLTPQWSLLIDSQGRQLPVAARYDSQGLVIAWLPYNGPGRRSPAQNEGKLSDKEITKALENISQTRMGAMMNAAKGFR